MEADRGGKGVSSTALRPGEIRASASAPSCHCGGETQGPGLYPISKCPPPHNHAAIIHTFSSF